MEAHHVAWQDWAFGKNDLSGVQLTTTPVLELDVIAHSQGTCSAGDGLHVGQPFAVYFGDYVTAQQVFLKSDHDAKCSAVRVDLLGRTTGFDRFDQEARREPQGERQFTRSNLPVDPMPWANNSPLFDHLWDKLADEVDWGGEVDVLPGLGAERIDPY
jgi:hypothetical protein